MPDLPIKTFPNPKEAALYAGFALNKLAENNQGKPLLLAVSGGSALGLLEGINPRFLGEFTTVTALDERFSADPETNNFLRLQKTDFYKRAVDAGANFFGTLPRPGETKEQLARRWEKNLRQWRRENPTGKIIATLGMGADGHTAGIMPFPEDPKKFRELFQSENWITAYDAADKNPYPERVTATISFLKLADCSVAYICGSEKQAALSRVKNRQNSAAELPAMAFWELGNLEIYTDLQ